MGLLLSVDPGIRGCGVAVFEDGTLLKASYVRNPVKTGDSLLAVVTMAQAVRTYAFTPQKDITALVVEWPRIYYGAKTKGDNNDLLPLAGVDSALAGALGLTDMHRYFPYEWKGQMPKGGAFEARVIERLTEMEMGRIQHVGKLDHNTYDGIGLAFHHLGRFERKRVYPRGGEAVLDK